MPEFVRIVDHRGEKIDGLHQGQFIAQPVYPGIGKMLFPVQIGRIFYGR